ncbi:MAG: hypothetical protein M1814_006077 [Vezdaea aestivalis]|nr:MAG: hypothetical protein M1814_006077 [Vezdaea aestivalis]
MSFPIFSLPEEIWSQIFTFLDSSDYCQAAKTSRAFYTAVIPLIWQQVDIVDSLDDVIMGDHGHGLRKVQDLLHTLAIKPSLAAHVRIVTHNCHLDPPDMFASLRDISLRGPYYPETYVRETRVLGLLELAIRHMVNVHTVRIIFGHHAIALALIRGFFSDARPRNSPVRKLWLETTCLDRIGELWIDPSGPRGVVGLNFSGLQSLQLRRLRFTSEDEWIESLRPDEEFWALSTTQRPNATRRFFGTDEDSLVVQAEDMRIEGLKEEARPTSILWAGEDESQLESRLVNSDENFWDLWLGGQLDPRQGRSCEYVHLPASPSTIKWVNRRLEQIIDTHQNPQTRQALSFDQKPLDFVIRVLTMAAPTLTSVNLDMIAGIDGRMNGLFKALPDFPNLLAFQFRNLLSEETTLKDEKVWLCHPEAPALSFLLRHPKVQCLSWPMRHFFPPDSTNEMEGPIVEEMIAHLGRTLKVFRTDDPLLSVNAAKSFTNTVHSRSRRRFIERLASRMRVAEIVKIEGGEPLTEARELIRALRHCPVRKLVVISWQWPLGEIRDCECALPTRFPTESQALIVRPAPALVPPAPPLQPQPDSSTPAPQQPAYPPFVSESDIPHLSWPMYEALPLPLTSIAASQFSSTLRELKFCGFDSAPDFWMGPAALTRFQDLTRALKHLPHLTLLHIPFKMICRLIQVDSGYLSAELPSFWASFVSPVQRGRLPRDMTLHLWKYFAPDAMAKRLFEMLGGLLSKERRAETEVRALLYVDDEVRPGSLFDFAVGVRADGSMGQFWGPRGERDPEKVKEKIESRAWF